MRKINTDDVACTVNVYVKRSLDNLADFTSSIGVDLEGQEEEFCDSATEILGQAIRQLGREYEFYVSIREKKRAEAAKKKQRVPKAKKAGA